MRVLFDNNVPAPLRHHLKGHQVRTAHNQGWHELENGHLLAAAERDGFDILVTADRKLSYQQNLQGRKLALVVLSTNDWSVIRKAPEMVAGAVNAARPGSFHEFKFDLPPRRAAISKSLYGRFEWIDPIRGRNIGSQRDDVSLNTYYLCQ